MYKLLKIKVEDRHILKNNPAVHPLAEAIYESQHWVTKVVIHAEFVTLWDLADTAHEFDLDAKTIRWLEGFDFDDGLEAIVAILKHRQPDTKIAQREMKQMRMFP